MMGLTTEKVHSHFQWLFKAFAFATGCIPQRIILSMMACLSIIMAYTMRNCMSMAMVEMTYSVSNSSNSSNPSITTEEKYHWDSATQGLILGSFYIGYIVTHLPGGLLAEKNGGKYALSLGILSTAFFTVIIPPVVRAGEN